ncbi:hypothetical protein C7S13_1437 [Burkholderia cepacia]|nr:hypothetical protein [Burkholderia cepacia]
MRTHRINNGTRKLLYATFESESQTTRESDIRIAIVFPAIPLDPIPRLDDATQFGILAESLYLHHVKVIS